MPHGQGIYVDGDDGSTYEGQWREHERHGKGVETFASGSLYDGEWKDSKPQGTGTLTFGTDGAIEMSGWEWVQCGDKYEGPFDKGELHGIGKWTWAKDGKTERIKTDHQKIIEWPDR